jgi:hypothetical protein
MKNNTKIISRIFLVVLLFALAVIATTVAKSSASNQKTTKNSSKEKAAENSTESVSTPQIIVYYFMTTYRCRSCTFIENTTKAALEQNFGKQLKNGNIVYKGINVDEPENKHYVNKYGLYTKTVIISSVEKEKELKWKNLDKIWNLVGQDDSFKAYITSELRNFMKS